jgi:hypothetical protein
MNKITIPYKILLSVKFCLRANEVAALKWVFLCRAGNIDRGLGIVLSGTGVLCRKAVVSLQPS